MTEGVWPASGRMDDCGCCEGLAPETPARVTNAPGLPAIGYRVGTHPQFKETMLAALSSSRRPSLSDLKTREDRDLSIALIDAWAVVADVLTFYQERIANESFLRTATERLSILQLARLIGYELRPGVAANAYLAFILETAVQAPRKVTVPGGTKVASIPGPDEIPQTFETGDAITARPELNALRPRLLQPQAISLSMEYVVVTGLAPGVQQGDRLLVVAGPGSSQRALKTVQRVVPDPAGHTTRLEFVVQDVLKPQIFTAPALHPSTRIKPGTALTASSVQHAILKHRWDSAELVAQAAAARWSLDDLATNIREQLAPREAVAGQGVYAFRTRASVFGHNAPAYASLPATLKVGTKLRDESTGTDVTFAAAYPASWEGRTLAAEPGATAGTTRAVCLDAVHPKIVRDSWVVLTEKAATSAYSVASVDETSRADFAISAKVTQVGLTVPTGDAVFGTFTIRGTSIDGESEQLVLADVPIVTAVKGDTIVLDTFYLGLASGRTVIVGGELDATPGVFKRETATLDRVTVEGGYTQLKFEHALAHTYVRDTVTINANVAAATHGESKREVLGSGDGSQAFQRFALRQPPLTYVSAPTASGVQTTLEVHVDGVRWHEVPTLYGRGLSDRVYVTRRADDGTTTVEFGDGITGARLPTGSENVVATYRKGIGLIGLVGAGQLSLLTTRPLGVKSVGNPLPAEGADDPEPREQARANAPRTVLTLDRVVSLSDYEDFARSFAGIAKALATALPGPRGARVVLTVAGPNGAVIEPDGTVARNLGKAIVGEGDVAARFELHSFRPVFFRIAATVEVDPDYLAENVVPAVERALRQTYSFDARAFGQHVSESEVTAVMQAVPGVVGVDLDALYRPPATSGLEAHLWAEVPHPGQPNPEGAELLMLDPRPVQLGVMA